MTLTTRRKITLVPVLRGRPRRVVSPRDQLVTSVVTVPERVRIVRESSAVEGGSLSEFIRNNLLHSIDIEAWKTSALDALDELNREEAGKANIRRSLATIRRNLALCLANGDRIGYRDLSVAKKQYEEEYEKIARKGGKREARLSTRLSLDEYEELAWKARQLSLTISDYSRMLLLGLNPGQQDRHMSPMARRRFYQAVLDIASQGWKPNPATRNRHRCQRCGHVNQ